MLCIYKTFTEGSTHLPARWVAGSAGLTLMVPANMQPKISRLGGITGGCSIWCDKAVAETPTCPGSTCPLRCPWLGCAWVIPVSCCGFLSRVGAHQPAKLVGTGCPGVQEHHPHEHGGNAGGVSPGEAELLQRQIGNHLEEQIYTSNPDCLAPCF